MTRVMLIPRRRASIIINVSVNAPPSENVRIANRTTSSPVDKFDYCSASRPGVI